MSEQQLKPEYQALADDFQRRFGDDGCCSCHICPPCSFCTHYGNPLNLDEIPEAWEDIPDDPAGYEVA